MSLITTRPIAHDLTYRAFGDLVGYVTASTQTVTGGERTLHVTNTYRGDDALIGVARTFVGEGAASSVDLMQQALSYTPAGLLRQRDDDADASNSRHYEYDALQRMTCEVRGDGAAQDCTETSDKLAGLFSYGNGESENAPPDTRLSAVIKVASAPYASKESEAYSYAAGNGRPLSVARSDGNLVIGYDGLGRRAFEYQAVSSPTGQEQSRRDYEHLPNGQLGEVHGWTPEGERYAVAIRYDAERRPNTIAYDSGDTYELFWDDMDRLVAASINGSHSMRWSYHYAGQTLVAATRETLGASTSVKRFWAVSDERGLISRMVDEDGATYWQAHWDATGWRSLEGLPQPDMWVPFGLPGQLILERTEASPGSGAISTRPSIVLNQLRAYDPLFGSFLQPDPADQTARLLPEGYLLARGDYLGHEDGSGAQSKIRDHYNRDLIPPGWELRFDHSCTAARESEIQGAINQANSDIDSCRLGACSAGAQAPNLKRQWIFALLTGVVYCVAPGGATSVPWQTAPVKANQLGQLTDRLGQHSNADTAVAGTWGLGGRQTIFGTSSPCLKETLAHEAMHGVLNTFPMAPMRESPEVPDGLGVGQLFYGDTKDWAMNDARRLDDHDLMAPYLQTCISCGNK